MSLIFVHLFSEMDWRTGISVICKLFHSAPLPSSPTGPSGNIRGDGPSGYIDPRFKRVLWYLIASTKGGVNRARIIELLDSQPGNANQLSSFLKLDYKTVIHHLKVLSENGLVITDNQDAYGATYFLTPLMEKNFASFKEILVKIGKK